jgi:hypothetical protein
MWLLRQSGRVHIGYGAKYFSTLEFLQRWKEKIGFLKHICLCAKLLFSFHKTQVVGPTMNIHGTVTKGVNFAHLIK